MRVAIHDATGRILRIVSAPVGNINIQLLPGEDWVQADDGVSDDTHYVVGALTVAMPPRPSRFHDFDYTNHTWKANPTAAWQAVRAERDRRIRGTDWTQLPDSPTTAQQVQQWRTYRQALRDVTSQPDPLAITWPTPPGAAG